MTQTVLADTLEVQRVAVAVGAAMVALETQVISALSLRPISAAVALAEVGLLLQKMAHLRDSCVAAAQAYASCEAGVPVQVRDLVGTFVPALAAVAVQQAAVIPGFGRASVFSKPLGDFSQLAPANLQAILARLQSTEQPEARLRIEQVATAGGGREFVVYVPGTRQMSFVPTNNPFNLTSAVTAVGSAGKAASERGVALAMQQAGIGAMKGDTVTLVGYSQGATIAANIASTPQKFRVRGLVSIAGPISARPLPSGLKVAALENTTDPVPWLDGSGNPANHNQVTAHIKTPKGFDGHDLDGYALDAKRIESASQLNGKRIDSGKNGFAAFNRELQEILKPIAGLPVKGSWYQITQNPWPIP
jgi:hypothetical protein